MEKKKYYLGLDVGTDSVGYAVTDKQYELLKYKGKPLCGSHLFEEGMLSDERRSFRAARRRLDRKKQRVALVEELFAKAVSEVDKDFFIRRKNSFLLREDAAEPYSVFNDQNYTDKDYYNKYPTIHHLITELMNDNSPHDVRLVFLAVAYLVKHRGHFLSDVSLENVNRILDFSSVHNELLDWFSSRDYMFPQGLDNQEVLSGILKQKISVSRKYDMIRKQLFDGRKPSTPDDSRVDYESFFKLLCASKINPSVLFKNEAYNEVGSFTLASSDDELAELFSKLDDDDTALLQSAKAVYDWTLLVDILNGKETISQGKISVYEQHEKDLSDLKSIIRKYAPAAYTPMFRDEKAKDNYPAYIATVKNSEAFFKRLNKLIASVAPADEDKELYESICAKLSSGNFLPKQVTSDNRVIPYQLYWYELDTILKYAQEYLPFLSDIDDSGLSVSDKIRSVFLFRVPYFVGPLNKHSQKAWLVRKAGKIYPWNIEEIVDYEKTEEEFIKNLVGRCTYLPGEDVLPKDSMLYRRFTVLNEINNLKIDDMPVSVELKQDIYNNVFMTNKKVTKTRLVNYLVANNKMQKDSKLKGIDDQIKSDLRPQHDFRHLLAEGKLTPEQVEAIIFRITISDDKRRFRIWLDKHHPELSESDRKYICTLKYKDFGRLSERFLTGVEGVSSETGEVTTIMQALWETNHNLMELLSKEKYSFLSEIERETAEYYSENPNGISARLDEMYINNQVKRSIYRALDIVSDVVKITGQAPEKIFVEMTRGAAQEQKNKRTTQRLDRILDAYSKCAEDTTHLRNQLENMGAEVNTRLQSKRLYLYFMQLGRDMYTGEPIELSELSVRYNIDHIYPQAFVKDDSIINNMVLVNSEDNGRKSDTYPVDKEIRSRMYPFWKMLLDCGLITEEKFKRLVRATPFSADEKWGFVNRQLTETSQSTKALATLLGELYPESEIVYVKARLTSEFRQEYSLFKSRSFNDLHHAKDAYLNIVAGNVYNSKFTKNWFLRNVDSDKYSIKNSTLFGNVQKNGDEVFWNGKASLEKVKKTVDSNFYHLTRFTFCRKGGLFDQMPVAAAEGLVPLKKNLPTEKYGGYNKPTVSFFMLVKYKLGKKTDIMFMSVQLVNGKDACSSEQSAIEYAQKRVSEILGKQVTDVSLPLGLRRIKINTMLSLDGFRVCISGSSNGGRQLIAQPYMPFMESTYWNNYVKALEKLSEKVKENPSYIHDEKYETVKKEINLRLYDIYIDKLTNTIYKKRPNNPVTTLEKGRSRFEELGVIEQAKLLLDIHRVFGCSATGIDLTLIDGVKLAGVPLISYSFTNLSKNYSSVRIIDSSASGAYEKQSANLLELL